MSRGLGTAGVRENKKPIVPPATVTAANDGVSLTGTTVKLGQPAGSNAANLTENRNIPLNGFALSVIDTDATGSQALVLDQTNQLYEIGDIGGVNNSTLLKLDDNAGEILLQILAAGGRDTLDLDSFQHSFVVTLAANRFLKLNKATKSYQIGDLDSVNNQSKIIIDDTAKQIQDWSNGNQLTVADSTGVFGIGRFSAFGATRLDVVDNTLAGANLVNFSTTSTGASGNLQTLLNLSLTGANATNNQNTYGVQISNLHSGAGNTNYGIYTIVQNAVSGICYYGDCASIAGGGGVAFYANAAGGSGVNANATSGVGVSGFATTGFGIVGSCNNDSGIAARFIKTPASTSNVQVVLQIIRNSQSAGANGIGGAITFANRNDGAGGLQPETNRITSKLTTATDTNEQSTLEIGGISAGAATTIMTIRGDGLLTLKVGDGVIMHTTTALTNGAAAQVGTLTNAPAAGNPTKWIPIDDNGTTRYLPAW